MAADNTNAVGASQSYNYSYTKPIESEKKVKEEVKDSVKSESVQVATEAKTTESSKATTETKQAEAKSIYEERQEEIKKQEEERKKEQDAEQRKQYLDDLTTKLNSKMNSFSENIKFGVNDKADSIVVSVMEQNNEKKIKELSSEEASKLFKRLDYVLGVLFDNKA
jgi:uncharacterized FlaG/YvyC family protein